MVAFHHSSKMLRVTNLMWPQEAKDGEATGARIVIATNVATGH